MTGNGLGGSCRRLIASPFGAVLNQQERWRWVSGEWSPEKSLTSPHLLDGVDVVTNNQKAQLETTRNSECHAPESRNQCADVKCKKGCGVVSASTPIPIPIPHTTPPILCCLPSFPLFLSKQPSGSQLLRQPCPTSTWISDNGIGHGSL